MKVVSPNEVCHLQGHNHLCFLQGNIYVKSTMRDTVFTFFCRMWPFREMQPHTWQSRAAQAQHTLQRCWRGLSWRWDLPANVGHKEQLTSCLKVRTPVGLKCPLLFIRCIFYRASKTFCCWLLPFAPWCEQLVCGAEQEQQLGFCSLIIPFTHTSSVECIMLRPAKRHNCSCCRR